VIKSAITSTLSDSLLQLSSDTAKIALSHCREMHDSFDLFGKDSEVKAYISKIYQWFLQCFCGHRVDKLWRENVIKSYHQLRISDNYKKIWVNLFHKVIKSEPSPFLYQHLGDNILKNLISIRSSKADNPAFVMPSKEEENAINYIAYLKLEKRFRLSTRHYLLQLMT